MKTYKVCIENTGYEASLMLGKIYEQLPAKKNDRELLRIIDESGEDYLYPAEMFYPIEITETLSQKLSLVYH